MRVNEDTVALAIFVMTILTHLISERWFKNIPRMFYPKEYELERSIQNKSAEAKPLNTPSTFHLYSKAVRDIQSMERDLEQLRAARRRRPLFIRILPHAMGYLCRYGFMIPMFKLWWFMEVVMVPGFLAFGVLPQTFRGTAGEVLMRVACAPFAVMERYSSTWNVTGVYLFGCDALLREIESDIQKRQPWHSQHREQWFRSVGVVGWFLLCVIAMRYVVKTCF
jgi:hypothetical protein